MIDGWTIYWITRLDAVDAWLTGTLIVFALMTAVGAMISLLWVIEYEKWPRFGTRGLSVGVVLCLLLSVAIVFVPTTKEAAAIVVIPAVANNETVQGEVSELYTLAKEWLEKQMTEEEEGTGDNE